MPEPEPLRHLSPAELRTLKIAAHRQLRRWNTVELRGELNRPERRDRLRRAVQILDEFSEGVELRPSDPG